MFEVFKRGYKKQLSDSDSEWEEFEGSRNGWIGDNHSVADRLDETDEPSDGDIEEETEVDVDHEVDTVTTSEGKMLSGVFSFNPRKSSLLSSFRSRNHSDDDENSRMKPKWEQFFEDYTRVFVVGIIIFLITDVVLLAIFFTSGPPNDDSPDPSSISASIDNATDYGSTTAAATHTTSLNHITHTRVGRFELLESVPHDTGAFTQGLEILSYEKIDIMREQYYEANNALVETNHSDDGIANGTFSNTSETTPATEAATSRTEPDNNNTSSTSWSQTSSSTFLSGYALESTGMYGDSTLRVVELASGSVVLEHELEDSYFAEGCTYYYVPPSPPPEMDANSRYLRPHFGTNGDASSGELENVVVRIVQITWKLGRGFVYELSIPNPAAARAVATNGTSSNDNSTQWSLSRIGDFEFSSITTNRQGWGIIYHPMRNQFIVSDGTRFLHFWELTETTTAAVEADNATLSLEGTNNQTNQTMHSSGPETIAFDFRLADKIVVQERRSAASTDWTPIRQLNELEWDPYSYGGNTILANIWQTNEIVRIWVGMSEDEETAQVHHDNIFAPNLGSINPDSNAGKVSHVYDLSSLEALAQPSGWGAVLNGIAFAYDSTEQDENHFTTGIHDGAAEELARSSADQFWVTGKYWPTMYRIRLLDEE